MNIYDQSYEDLINYFENINETKFRADQVFDWIYKKRVTSFKEMTNIKKELITKLENDFTFEKPIIIKKQNGKGVHKYLFKLEDNNTIEAVLMIHDYGNSLCISTEVGCNMGCSFCESGRRKKVRELRPSEMVTQILQIEEDLKIRISHIVLMGIGEPFDNYNNVMKFIKIVNDDKAIAIGSRHITISTSGIIPKIIKFADEKTSVNLAISLHAPNDEIRNKLMKINKVYKIEDLIKAVKYYIKKTNRRVTFEYIMLKNINDTKECALQLAQLLKGMNAYVNLIPYNETSNTKFKRANSNTVMKFYDILKKNKINVTIRKEFGSEVSAACGQLRSDYEEGK